MSVLSPQIFANEEARDWLFDLFDERDIYFIHNTLEIIVDYPSSEKPESWDSLCALAAAELVAAARGNPSADFPPEARDWLDAYGMEVDNEVTTLARKAIDRVQSDSVLKDELEADGKSAEWQSVIKDLRHRLGL